MKIDGKVHSGVLFLKKELKDIERKEEFLSYDDSIFDDFRNNEGVRFGIINVCTGKNGFINQEYVDKRIFPDYILDGTQSTIFETPNVKFKPSTTKLRTVKYIYLVAYYVKGTVINTKNGEEQPALDYSQPVSIIKSVTKKEYAHIKITETGVLIEKIKGQDAIAQEEKVNEVDIQKKYEYLRELSARMPLRSIRISWIWCLMIPFSLFRLPHRRRLRERYRRSIEKKYCRETVLWKKCR